MFIPLHDANTLKHIRLQYVTLGIIALNIVIWLFTGLLATGAVSQAAIVGFGYIPAVAFNHAELEPELAFVPEGATYLTYAFFHTGFWHLAGNMIFLWVFGDNVEDAMGHLRFLLFYLACAAAGALCHGLLGPDSRAPLVGASGAIAGVVAAYLILHPRVRVWILVLFRIPLPLPAFVPLLLFIGQQFLMVVIEPDSEISWGAHVGGILAGAVLVLALKRRDVPLFDRRIVTPRSVRQRTEDDVQPPKEPRARLPWDRS